MDTIDGRTAFPVATYRLLIGDVREQVQALPEASVQCVITSPPYYGLRSYLPPDHPAKAHELGQERTPRQYLDALVAVFRDMKRVLRPDGTCWVNLGDAYAGSGRGAWSNPSAAVKETYIPDPMTLPATTGDRPAKSLLMLPARFALAMQDDGWILRSDIIWHKPNAMPSSVRDRPTSSYEHIFLFAQQPRYYYDAAAIAEPAVVGDNGSYFDRGKTGAAHPNQGQDRRDKQRLVGNRTYSGFNDRWQARTAAPRTRNRRDVWRVNTTPYPEAHFAVWPEKLVELMVLAGCPDGGTVLDPFAGSGTTLAVANRLGRHAIGIELNAEYGKLVEQRLIQAHWALDTR
jgi:DNA modification methylase